MFPSKPPNNTCTEVPQSAEPSRMGSKFTSLYAHLISLIFHIGFLLLLAAMVLPGSPFGKAIVSLTATMDSASKNLDDRSFELAAPTIDMAHLEQPMDSADLEEDEKKLLEPTLDVSMPELVLEPTLELESMDFSEAKELEKVTVASGAKSSKARSNLRKLLTTASRSGKNVTEPLMTVPTEGIVHSDTVENATSDLLGGLKQGITDDGMTKIIWLMDASLSLKEERRVLAPQVAEFYGQLLEEQLALMEQDVSMRVNSIVFAFGATLQPVRMDRGPVTPEAISRGIEHLPIDETGVENVMTALITAVSSVASGKKERIEIVIWTDESGDDLHRLEDAIALCRALKARVHIVGPLSVLGMRDGTQQFELPKPWEYRVELPVMRGPDSAFPERAQLPMWFDSNAASWEDGPVVLAANSGNLGGPHRRKLLAPTGPYALTRLALATGGRFIALRRDGDRALMQGDRYKDYLPDYGSGLEVLADIESKPLRRAVVEAASITDAKIYAPPNYLFPTLVQDSYPYSRGLMYVRPENFSGVLNDQLNAQIRKLAVARRTVQQAIDVMLFQSTPLATSGTGRDNTTVTRSTILSLASIPPEYEYEKSPRWRAWYDLNLGRLLYQSVRIDSYIALASEMTSSSVIEEIQKNEFNSVLFRHSTPVASSSELTARASLGRQLLERVVEQHPDTPWSQLALWELEHPPGFTYEFGKVSPPKPVVGRVMLAPTTPSPRIPRL
jgi:hypothetical protein